MLKTIQTLQKQWFWKFQFAFFVFFVFFVFFGSRSGPPAGRAGLANRPTDQVCLQNFCQWKSQRGGSMRPTRYREEKDVTARHGKPRQR